MSGASPFQQVQADLPFVDHGTNQVVHIEEVEHKCGDPRCGKPAKYRVEYGLRGIFRCARHLGSMVIFALDDKSTVEVTRL